MVDLRVIRQSRHPLFLDCPLSKSTRVPGTKLLQPPREARRCSTSSRLVPGIPVALLRNATLFAAFGSMYFEITFMSDVEHRQQFFAPIIDEVERALAVRAVYLAER